MQLLSKYLRNINVAHTKSHLKSLFEQYPYRGSLWSYHKILDEYGVPNISFRVRSKDLIGKISTPFLAEVNKDIVIVDEVTEETVLYETSAKCENKPLDDFLSDWTGVVLRGIPNEESKEEGYKQNVRQSRKEKAACILCCACLVCIMAYTSSVVSSYRNWGVWYLLAIITSFAGLFFTSLLLGKEHRLFNNTSDRLCGILSRGKCGKSSVTGKTRVFGMFDLSECGTAYFLANSIVLLFAADSFIYALSYMAICTLPVVIWSISYQWKKGQWCLLCLFTMSVLLMQAIIYFSDGIITDAATFLKSKIISFLVLACAYYPFVCLIHRWMLMLGKWKGMKQRKEGFLRIKNDKVVFLTKLHNQKRLLNNEYAFVLIFGEETNEKPVITIVGNPYCNPCALMHKRLGKLLKLGFQIQYFFTFFEEKLSLTNKEILASYFKNGEKHSWTLLSEWYENGRHTEHHYDPQLTETDLQDKRVSLFFERQKEWIEKNRIQATPFILIEGYPMPSDYEIEDLYHIY